MKPLQTQICGFLLAIDMRIALPKGKLLPNIIKLLSDAGISLEFKNDRDYHPTTNYGGFDVKLFKARSIPQLVALGRFDLGFCGHDVVLDTAYDNVKEILITKYNPVQIVAATLKENDLILSQPPKRPLLIATEYENIANDWAMKQNISHIVLQSRGSTEAYPPEDADIIIDCVETGSTLEANGLIIINKLFNSTTVLITNKDALMDNQKSKEIDSFLAKIKHD